MKRLLNPLTNPAGYTAFTAALYAIIRAVTDKGGAGSDPQVWLTAGMAVVSFVTRFYVTPVRDPKDGAGNPLLTANAHAAENLRRALERGGEPLPMAPGPVTHTGPPGSTVTYKTDSPPAQPPAGTTP